MSNDRFQESLEKMSPQERYELQRKLERRGTFFEDWVDNKPSRSNFSSSSSSSSSNTDYSWQSGNNIMEPIADLIFNIIVAIWPGFKR